MLKRIPKLTSVLNRPEFRPRYFALALALGSFVNFSSGFAQQRLAGRETFVTPIQWKKQNRVTKYRLQIATDDDFTDVRFDGPVTGERYFVSDLPPGRYYWRVAPSDFQTGKFLEPVAFDVQGARADTHISAERTVARFPGRANGWVATTGDIATPQTARLRTGAEPDFIGVNAEGTVYAVNSSNGVALWVARYGSNSVTKTATPATSFRPLLLTTRNRSSAFPIAIVIVAYDGGVRALNPATGHELWRTKLSGPAVAGVSTDGTSTGGKAYLVVNNSQGGDALVVLSTSSGRIEAEKKLNGVVGDGITGRPFWFGDKNSPRLMMQLRGDEIAVYDPTGQLLCSTKLNAGITAAPVVVETARRELMFIGTRKGLAVYSAPRNAADFKFVQYIGRSDGQPVNSLAVVDLEGNKAPSVVAITERGRVFLVDPDQMTITWSADVAAQNSAASFADVNGDGRLDILLPGRDDFAIAQSAGDGSIIWKSSGLINKREPDRSNMPPRSLGVARLSNGHLILVRSDVTSGGLRAIEVVPATVTSSVR